MTNLGKFIEVMNQTFNARFKPENMKLECSPCGALKKPCFACDNFKCDGCKRWWHKEYHPMGLLKTDFTVLIFALRYAAPRQTYAPTLTCDYAKSLLPRMSEEQRQQLQDELVTLMMPAPGYDIDEIAAKAMRSLLEEVKRYDADESTD